MRFQVCWLLNELRVLTQRTGTRGLILVYDALGFWFVLRLRKYVRDHDDGGFDASHVIIQLVI